MKNCLYLISILPFWSYSSTPLVDPNSILILLYPEIWRSIHQNGCSLLGYGRDVCVFWLSCSMIVSVQVCECVHACTCIFEHFPYVALAPLVCSVFLCFSISLSLCVSSLVNSPISLNLYLCLCIFSLYVFVYIFPFLCSLCLPLSLPLLIFFLVLLSLSLFEPDSNENNFIRNRKISKSI